MPKTILELLEENGTAYRPEYSSLRNELVANGVDPDYVLPELPVEEDPLKKVARLLARIKSLTDPDFEPVESDNRKQILAMRDRASDAWVLAAEALEVIEDAR